MKLTLFKKMLFVVLVFALAACAAKEEKAKKRIVWPLPPERPRFEWIEVYYSDLDLPRSNFQSKVADFVGEKPGNFFRRPFGIASRGDGKVYVGDVEQSMVKIFNFNDGSLKILGKEEEISILRPLGMALDGEGRLYVADASINRIWVFSASDELMFVFGDKDNMERPSYIAVNDGLGRVYVSDGKGAKIVVYSRDGKFQFTFGRYGGGDGQFISPQGLAIDDKGRVFVADMNNARIQVFDADGKFLYKFGVRGDKIFNFDTPKDLAFDSEGNLHILDTRKSALLSYTPEGEMLLYLGGEAVINHPLGFALPSSIWIDKNDRVYITDQFLKRFSVWQYLNDEYLEKNPIDPKDVPVVAK